MFIATMVLSGLLAFVFGAAAVGKLTTTRTEHDKAVRWAGATLVVWPARIPNFS